MPTKQEFEIAQNELIAFLSRYSGMLVEHLNQIRDVMSQTTEQVMDGVIKISDAREVKKQMAETVLVKKEKNDGKGKIQGDDEIFKVVSNKDISEKDSSSPENVNGGKSDATVVIKQHISSFANLDGRIEEMLFMVMGSLSTDDVVGQRMEHINSALKNLSHELAGIIGNNPSDFKETEIKNLESKLLSEMKKSYTMVDEHEVLDMVINKPSHRKAS